MTNNPLDELMSLDDDCLLDDEVCTSLQEPTNLTEPDNLLSGMQTILECARHSSLSSTYFEKVKVPMNYLCRRLSLTPTQVTLLAIIMEISLQRRTSIGNISHYLDTSNLELMNHSADLTQLVTKRFVLERKNNNEIFYVVPGDVYDAFRRNEAYTYKVPMLHNDDELAIRLDRMLSALDTFDVDKDIVLFDHDVQELLNTNSHIHLARTLLSVQKKCRADEFRVVLLLSMFWIRDEDTEVDGHRFSVVISRQMEVRQMILALQKGRSVLVKKKIVTASSSAGLMNSGVFSLTPQFRKLLTPDRTISTTGEEAQLSNRLTRHADIQQKELFYNPDVEGEVKRLQELLHPQQMDGVLSRLKERGLRGGFTCLLYGGPGTGKTETVLQLARESGRDIFQIDVSKLRSKWYGESERLVKEVFDDYRRMVKQSKVAPIMFFNEADAIFNRRMENAERSVDKGENALQNIILQEMETLDGILIATTNLQGNLDDAFERRFLYKMRLEKPSTEVKARIWRSMLPDLTEEESRLLADEFDFSGGQIENVVRKRFIDEVITGDKATLADLQALCRNEQLDNNRRKSIGFLR